MSNGEKIVRYNALERALERAGTMFLETADKNAKIRIQEYHDLFGLALIEAIEALRAPWYARLWYRYLRPMLELYGLPALKEERVTS
jgi:hypothetical protein